MWASTGYEMSTQETEASDTEEETQEVTSSCEYEQDDVMVRSFD